MADEYWLRAVTSTCPSAVSAVGMVLSVVESDTNRMLLGRSRFTIAPRSAALSPSSPAVEAFSAAALVWAAARLGF